MKITTTACTDGMALYTATSSAGQVLAARTRTPLLDAARAMMVTSTSLSTHWLEMHHQGSTTWALRTTIGHASSPVFRRHEPKQIDQGCVIPSSG